VATAAYTRLSGKGYLDRAKYFEQVYVRGAAGETPRLCTMLFWSKDDGRAIPAFGKELTAIGLLL